MHRMVIQTNAFDVLQILEKIFKKHSNIIMSENIFLFHCISHKIFKLTPFHNEIEMLSIFHPTVKYIFIAYRSTDFSTTPAWPFTAVWNWLSIKPLTLRHGRDISAQRTARVPKILNSVSFHSNNKILWPSCTPCSRFDNPLKFSRSYLLRVKNR